MKRFIGYYDDEKEIQKKEQKKRKQKKNYQIVGQKKY